jgi:hypothetical protein
MGKKFIALFHLSFHPNFALKPPVYLDFPLRIMEGTPDHLTNGLHRTGNFHLFQLSMDQNLFFIG